jgi:hypothetical protein
LVCFGKNVSQALALVFDERAKTEAVQHGMSCAENSSLLVLKFSADFF